MSRTAAHNTEGQDQTLSIINSLAMLDLKSLSFLQLKQLQKALRHAADDIKREAEDRAETDVSGDTVKVQSPDL